MAIVVAVLVLLVSLSAEAKKKKKASKKHKTPAAKHTSKSKSTKSKESDRGLPPPESAPETDEATKEKEEKAPAPSKAAAEPGEGEEKKPTPPPTAEEETPPPKAPPPKGKPPREAAEPEGGSAGGGPIALSLGVGGRALFRNLTWTDSMGALAPYSLSPGPEAAVWLEAFPAAFATDGFASNIGVFGHFNYGLGASSKTPPPANMTLTTKYQDFFAGVKVRFPVGIMLPYVAGGYGMQKFSLTPVAQDRPNFNYAFAGGGAGARIQFTPMFDLDASGMFLYVLNPGSAAGEVASNAFYPDATAYGIDASLSIGVRLFSVLGLRAGGDFRQFGLTTHWKSTNMGLRAGGAADRNIGVWGGVEIVFDGMGGGGGHAGGEGEEGAPVKKAAPKAKKAAPSDIEPEEGAGAGAGGEAGGGAGAGSGPNPDE